MQFSFVPPEEWVLAIMETHPLVLVCLLTLANLSVLILERSSRR
jgi:hypothetical protein